jgi:hypothetical protein
MKKQISNAEFQEMRSQVCDSESVSKTVHLSTISLDDKSLIKGEIQISGMPAKVEPSFFLKLASMLKVSKSLTTEMIKNEDSGLAVSLMNGLKEYRIAKGKDHAGNVVLVANRENKSIIDIVQPTLYRRLTNESVFDITERIMNDNKNLSIETIDRDFGNGRLSINLLNNEDVGFPGAGKDEFFKFGFSIIQTTRNTMADLYNQRLVCSNGLRVSLGQGAIGGSRAINFNEKFKLEGNSAEDIRSFLMQIGEAGKAGFIPSGFGDALTGAVNTKSSLYELEHAMLKAHAAYDKDESPEVSAAYIAKLDREFFHGYGDTMSRIIRKGTDPLTLNDRQKGFIKTNMSVWDVVNSLTFLGSNNSTIPLKDSYRLKEEAGDLFGKGTKGGYDLQFAQFAQL